MTWSSMNSSSSLRSSNSAWRSRRTVIKPGWSPWFEGRGIGVALNVSAMMLGNMDLRGMSVGLTVDIGVCGFSSSQLAISSSATRIYRGLARFPNLAPAYSLHPSHWHDEQRIFTITLCFVLSSSQDSFKSFVITNDRR